MSYAIERLPAVVQRTGLSRATIFRRIREGQFPEPITLCGRTKGWIAAEIDEWIEARRNQSRSVGDRA